MTPDYCSLPYADQLDACQPLTWSWSTVVGVIGWIIIYALAIKFLHWAITHPVRIPLREPGLWHNREYRRNRETVMKQYGRRCAMCGSTVGVEMHHIRSRASGGGHEISNLIPLCHMHHQYIHGRRFGRRA